MQLYSYIFLTFAMYSICMSVTKSESRCLKGYVSFFLFLKSEHPWLLIHQLSCHLPYWNIAESHPCLSHYVDWYLKKTRQQWLTDSGASAKQWCISSIISCCFGATNRYRDANIPIVNSQTVDDGKILIPYRFHNRNLFAGPILFSHGH